MSLRDELDAVIERIATDCCPLSQVRADAAGDPAATLRLWRQLVEAGLDRATTPEMSGGAGLGWREVLPLVEAVGAFALPVPLAETLAARALAARLDCALPDGAAGLVRLVPVAQSDGMATGAAASGGAAGWLAASLAWPDRLASVVGVTADGTVFVLDPAAAVREDSRNPAGELRSRASWRAADLGAAAGRLEPGIELFAGAALRAAQLAGAMRRVLAMTVDYASQREQFGRPIGRFQAVQQQLALMAELTVQAGLGAELAFSSDGLAFDPLRAASAKQVASANALQCAAIAHAVHGAIGVTEDYDLQLFTRRLKAWAGEWGGASYWAGFIGRNLIAGPHASVWHAVIEASRMIDGDG
ncbi:MAG: acyl-CoA dehydrogenase family protein [Burkholderiaceae bacterium]